MSDTWASRNLAARSAPFPAPLCRTDKHVLPLPERVGIVGQPDNQRLPRVDCRPCQRKEPCYPDRPLRYFHHPERQQRQGLHAEVAGKVGERMAGQPRDDRQFGDGDGQPLECGAEKAAYQDGVFHFFFFGQTDAFVDAFFHKSKV